MWLDGHGIEIAGLWAEHFNVGWLLRAMQYVTGRANSLLSFWLIALVYVVLGLIEIARRASDPIDYDFNAMDADRSFFCLKVRV